MEINLLPPLRARKGKGYTIAIDKVDIDRQLIPDIWSDKMAGK